MQLNDTVQHLVPMLRSMVGDDISLELELAPDLAPVVGDPGQLEQVFRNLFDNALTAIKTPMTQSQMFGHIAEEVGITKKQVSEVEIDRLHPEAPGK